MLPELSTLTENVSQCGKLGDDQQVAAQTMCRVLCEQWPQLSTAIAQGKWNPRVEVIPEVMSRILLYKDANIDIRAHLFLENADETYTHNHGSAFVSTCLEGGYEHQMFAVTHDYSKTKPSTSTQTETNDASTETGGADLLQSMAPAAAAAAHAKAEPAAAAASSSVAPGGLPPVHYAFERSAGGAISFESTAHPGELTNVLCQPFQAGQSLLITSNAYHRVAAYSGCAVATIIIKDIRHKGVTHVVSNSSKREDIKDEINHEADATERAVALARMDKACKSYLDALARGVPQQSEFRMVHAQLSELKTHVKYLSESEWESQARELAVGVAVYLINWALPAKVSAIESRRQLQVVTWLETLLARRFEPTELDLDGKRFKGYGADAAEVRNSFLRICCSVHTQRNGWDLARALKHSKHPRTQVRELFPDMRLRKDVREEQTALEPEQTGTMGNFLVAWAQKYSPALEELGHWIRDEINAKMEAESGAAGTVWRPLKPSPSKGKSQFPGVNQPKKQDLFQPGKKSASTPSANMKLS